ncbi:uncharacterized protein LOC128739941 [Sabethes cyaneus]|uniref:uncharacterized protein LOC128739941 n=1 Tax=Sabethes cyaneus TaxID=53552 RepID=UPI00237E673F|nr:uncharacterized protein LOC128739941 [Sabethes cyaneus]
MNVNSVEVIVPSVITIIKLSLGVQQASSSPTDLVLCGCHVYVYLSVCLFILPEETTESRTAAATAAVASTTAAVSTMERNSRTDASGRSAALERAYVHDVYENCEEPVGHVRPKVAQFLAGLEPGSVVCDVGCGNGRYLTGFNPTICTIGVDRCYRLAKVGHGKGSEVAICDNLELPFRDESFDAVLSLAVVHHFATTERRVGAIRELARILRIGGRVIITVWALEQRHRRFESQDVLVPWQSPRSKTSPEEEEDEDFLPPYHAYAEDSTNSSRSAGDGDSSSLSSSSPGETCYSFVKKALQKLAGSKKSPWFLESWSSRETKHDSSLDYEDAKDLPIELRRLEDLDDVPEPPLSAGLKSRSLGSILNTPPKTIVRSRSSVPSLGAQIPESEATPSEPSTSRRPKLVKQKQSLCDDVDYKLCESAQAYREHILRNESRIQLLRKQSSLNEELMAESRLREKDRIRKRIQKQMSLNESFLCRSLFTKRLQVIKEEFTTKIKTSTGSLERVTKNGFVKIMQNIKASAQAHHSNTHPHNRSYDSYVPGYSPYTHDSRPGSRHLSRNNSMNNNGGGNGSNGTEKLGGMGTSQDESKPRRHSRESGSESFRSTFIKRQRFADSSKDSSLQSDTSIESEDSFASVIYIPKPEQQHQQQYSPATDGVCSGTTRLPSGPASPLIMPCPTPAHSPAPPHINPVNGDDECSKFSFEDATLLHRLDEISPSLSSTTTFVQSTFSSKIKLLKSPPSNALACTSSTILTASSNNKTTTSSNSNACSPGGSISTTDANPPVQKITRQQIKDLPPIPKFRKSGNYPILRRQSSTSTAAPVVPKLLSLELFNPETDDLDSDYSEPSSPDSIDSVISALRPSGTSELVPTNQQPSHPAATTIPPLVEAAAVVAHKLEDAVELVIRESENKPRVPNASSDSHNSTDDPDPDDTSCRQHLVDFAEKLSAQLLKELENEKEQRGDSFEENDDESCDSKFQNKALSLADAQPYLKKLNGDMRDLNQLRAELRERRLMLANLSHLGMNGLGGSNDSLGPSYGSSMTPIIQEESDDDDELIDPCDFQPDDFENCNEMRGAKLNLTKNDEFVIIPELDENDADITTNNTALLIQEEESSVELPQNIDIEFLGESNSNNNSTNDSHLTSSRHILPLKTINLSSTQLSVNIVNSQQHNKSEANFTSGYCSSSQQSTSQQETTSMGGANETNNNKKMPSTNKSSIESHNSVDSWAHSTSSASLDSPSVGGAATHHRYYHVFREGELDALINHHVASLHIVSSYYERASWCVVAEKVQVWTI